MMRRLFECFELIRTTAKLIAPTVFEKNAVYLCPILTF